MDEISVSSMHPTQPLVLDPNKIVRFKENAIVRYLLDRYSSMNELACLEFSDEDRTQFAQLIGYSFNGFMELSYVSDEAVS